MGSGVTDSESDPVAWIAEERTDDRVGFRVGRARSRLVAEFVGVGTLEAEPTGRWTRFVPAPGASPEHVAKVERGLVRALVAHLNHRLAFHGSAAEKDGRAVVCLGRSEAGKSTAAAELCTRRGLALLADDAVILEQVPGGFDVAPTEDSHWLLDASARVLGFPAGHAHKARLAPGRSAEGPARLVAICQLAFDDAVSAPALRRLHGQELLATLSASAIRLVIDDPARHVEEVDQLAALASAVAVYELKRPRDLTKLTLAGDLLEGLVREL
jgi:hypothetical protein